MKNLPSILLFVLASLTFNACTGPQIKSSSLPARYEPSPEAIPAPTVATDDEGMSKEEIRKYNIQAKKPTFAIIGAFYQLPETRTAEVYSYREGQFFGGGYESLTVAGRPARTFALTPFDTRSSFAAQSVMNEMLDAGVKFVEISMGDALKVMNAESKERGLRILPKLLPSGADYLISIQQGTAEGLGAIWAGRVVSTKDGQMIAFASVPAVGSWTIQPLLKTLIGDSLRRLAQRK